MAHQCLPERSVAAQGPELAALCSFAGETVVVLELGFASAIYEQLDVRIMSLLMLLLWNIKERTVE
jgi:hypothetical protein